MKLFKVMLFLVLATVLVGSWASSAAAQSVISGEIGGIVTDPSGAVVPNASVSLTSAATGYNETTTTGDSGTFRFALVKPGSYTLTVAVSGFSTVKRTVVSSVGQVTQIPVQLEVGAKTEIVEITGAAPLLQTENANLATTVDRQTIDLIPSAGMDMTNYAMTTPGVTLSTGGGYGNFSANGLPGTSNLYTVNGGDMNDPENNLNNSGSSNMMLGANELQEVSVVTNGYTGEYGRAAGANVNYTTKSGTNQFHGNAVWNYNGSVLNANDFFNNATDTPRPHAVSNQWAGSVGGPIIKDKLFFFYDNEGIRYVLPGGGQVFVPSAAFATGTLANITAVGPAGSSPFYQNIFSLYSKTPGISGATPVAVGTTADANPNGNNGGCGDLTGAPVPGQANTYWGDGPRNATTGAPIGTWTAATCAQTLQSNVNSLNIERLQTFTIDWVAGPNDTFKFRYKQDRGVQATGTDPINAAFNANSNQPEDDGQMSWTHVINNHATNQFIMGGLYYSAIFGPVNIANALGTFPTTLAFNDGLFNNLGGNDFNYPQGRNVAQYQFVDDVSWTRGNHGIKFGVNFRRNNIASWTAGFETSGLLTVNSMTEFYDGIANANSYAQGFANQTAQPTAYYSLGLYVQDEWRVSRKLKVTLALRADRNSNLVCVDNCYARPAGSFLNMDHNINTPYDQSILTGLHDAIPNLQSVAWGPRAGFAWTPTSKGDLVIRGGGGLFPQLYPGSIGDRFIQNAPSVTNFTVGASTGNTYALAFGTGTLAMPDVRQQAIKSNEAFQSLFSAGGTLADMQDAVTGFTLPNLNTMVATNKNMMVYEWNLQVEKSFGGSNMVSVNYVGNIGANIFVRNPGLNAYCVQSFPISNPPPPPAPQTTPNPLCTGGLQFNGNIPNAPLDPRFGSILELQNNGKSNYNGMTATASHRFTHGFSVNFNYTWSHSLDDVSNGGLYQYDLNNAANSFRVQLNPYNLKNLNYSNSDYDFRHSLSANYYWEIPFKSSNRLAEEAIGGWNIGGTVFYKTGEPYSVYNSTDRTTNLANSTGMIILGDFLGGATSCGAPNYGCPLSSQFAYSQAAGNRSSQPDLGNYPRNSFRGPGFFDTDFSLHKNFHVRENMVFTVGATAYNAFNHPNFDNPHAAVSSSSTFGKTFQTIGTPNSPYGNFTGAIVNGRVMQVDMKFKF